MNIRFQEEQLTDKIKRVVTLRGLSVLAIFICLFQTPVKSFPEVESPVLQAFSIAVSEARMKEMSPRRQWDYLTEVFTQKFEDIEEADGWIFSHMNELAQKGRLPDARQLKELIDRAYESKCTISQEWIARFTLSSENAAHYEKSHGMAYAILLNHFESLQLVDSIEAYIPLLEAHLEDYPDQLLLISQFSHMASLAHYKGDIFDAVVNYQKALALTDPQDTFNLFILNKNLASSYANMDFIERAAYHADRCIELFDIDKIPIEYMVIFGIIKSNNFEFEEAEEFYQRAISHAEQYNLKGLLAQSYSNFGNLKRKQRQFDNALYYIGLSDTLCLELGIELGLLINKVNRAEAFLDQGLAAMALRELESGAQLLKKMDLTYINMEYYKLKYRIQDELGDEVGSNRSFRTYTECKNEFIGDVPRSILAEWELATEREQRNIEANALNLSLEREVKQKYLIGFIMALFLLAFTIAFFLIGRRRILERERLERERQDLRHNLELKSKELLSESLTNMNIQQIKVNLLSEIRELVSTLPRKEQQIFSEFLYRLGHSKESRFLDEFEMRFKGVHEDFFQNLHVLAPDLSPNELRVCAFIRLNITTKDIASLTGKSKGTIENTRMTIRRKLNLDTEVNLQQYLLSV